MRKNPTGTKLKQFKKEYADSSFSVKEALRFGFTKRQFYLLVKQGEFERIDIGFYRLRERAALSLDARFKDLSKLIHGKSAICLITALSYYGLSDEIVTVPWFIVDHGTTSTLKSVKLFRKRKPHWEIGITKKNGFLITSLERTIVECLAYKQTATGFEGVHALRKAIRKGMVRIENIFKVAKALGYNKRIRGILEAYLDEGA